MKKKVLLNTVTKIQDFVHITNGSKFDIDLLSGSNTYLDAKSLLGVLSCDYSKPLVVDIHADDDDAEMFFDELDRFVVTNN